MYGFRRSTIISHLRDFLLEGGRVEPQRLHDECTLPPAVQDQVLALFGELGSNRLAPVYEAMNGSIDYEDLHLLRLLWLASNHTI